MPAECVVARVVCRVAMVFLTASTRNNFTFQRSGGHSVVFFNAGIQKKQNKTKKNKAPNETKNIQIVSDQTRLHIPLAPRWEILDPKTLLNKLTAVSVPVTSWDPCAGETETGAPIGAIVGAPVGLGVGDIVGLGVGDGVGLGVGLGVGDGVGWCFFERGWV